MPEPAHGSLPSPPTPVVCPPRSCQSGPFKPQISLVAALVLPCHSEEKPKCMLGPPLAICHLPDLISSAPRCSPRPTQSCLLVCDDDRCSLAFACSFSCVRTFFPPITHVSVHICHLMGQSTSHFPFSKQKDFTSFPLYSGTPVSCFMFIRG